MKRIVPFLLLLMSLCVAHAQDSPLGNWLIFFGNKSLGSRLNLHAEAQYRNYNAFGDTEQLLLRTGLGVNLTENNNNALLGYAFVHSENYIPGTDEKTSTAEHRVFQQFITRQRIGRVAVQHRYRFEQRFFTADFRLRFRYFLSLNLPLNHKEMSDKTLYLSAYDEIFLQPTGSPFDRNRLYGGLGFKFNDRLRLELGYMNQYLATTSRDQVNLIAFLNL